MYISREEYKLLRKFYKSDGISISMESRIVTPLEENKILNDISDILLKKGYLEHKHTQIMRDGSRRYSAELIITNSGIIACENYEDFKSTNFRSWSAIIISILSLLISLVSLYSSVF